MQFESARGSKAGRDAERRGGSQSDAPDGVTTPFSRDPLRRAACAPGGKPAGKTVMVWKLDRLSRRLRDGVNLLADWCDRGIRVVSITQQIDLSGPVGRMIAAVMLGLW